VLPTLRHFPTLASSEAALTIAAFYFFRDKQESVATMPAQAASNFHSDHI
jgi:hypothetical protein